MLADPLVTFVGEIGDRAKNDFIGNARALLMPIDWPEPFGLVMIEAMACGTPVIAYGHGSVPEITSPGQFAQVEMWDPSVPKVSLEQMVRLGEELIGALRRHTPELVCHAGVSKGAVTVRIVNTNGTDVSYRQSHFSASVSGELIRGTDMLFVGDMDVSCHPILDARQLSANVIQQLEWAKTIASVSTGPKQVIFTPSGVGSALASPLMAGFNGKSVYEGASPVAQRVGQSIVDSGFSLFDDPTLAFRPSSRPFDDEGVPSQRIALIDGGVVRNFLYDLQTAGLAGTKSTGSAGRGRGLPSPSPSAFTIRPGNIGFEQMVAQIDDGLVVEELMGAEQGNILGGDFSGNVLLGYKVENGKIVGRVKNTMVSGNVYQLLKKVTAIGSDARWVGHSLYTPSLFFPSVSVASK